MNQTLNPGQMVIYTNGDRVEFGIIKRPNNTGTGYFVYYHTGDTAANTPTHCLSPIHNEYAIEVMINKFIHGKVEGD